MKRLWDQLAETVAEKLREQVENEVDVDSLADDIIGEMDVAEIVVQVHEGVVRRARNGIVDTTDIAEEIVDDIVPK